jgi:hypothetical protein
MTVTINGTTGVAGVDGTAATPAIQGNDTNTGIFFPAADTIAFAEGGAEVARFDSSGRLGVGVTNPQTRVQISGTVDDANVQDYITLSRVSYPTDNFRQVISASCGSVASQNNIAFKTSDGTNAPAERMRIGGDGNVFIAKTSDNDATQGISFYTSGNASFNDNNSGTRTVIGFRRSGTLAGSITTTATTVAYNTSSDYRLKENIAPMTSALAKVSALKPVTYTWKLDGSNGQGFIAHELQEVVPECVTGEKDATETVDIKDEDGKVIGQETKPVYQGIDTSFLVATLTAAIQELKAELDTVKTELATLKGQA